MKDAGPSNKVALCTRRGRDIGVSLHGELTTWRRVLSFFTVRILSPSRFTDRQDRFSD